MQLSAKNLKEIQNSDLGITIGSFDGIHKGHQFVLEDFIEECKKRNLKAVVISFNPHPMIVIKKLENYLIDSSNKKESYLKNKLAIDLIEVDFDDKLQKMSGEEFFKELLDRLSNIKLLYAGHDFSLGKGKEFSVNQAHEKLKSIEVIEGKVFHCSDHIYSSSLIRECLSNGDIQKANYLLGHPFRLIATVIGGSKIGRTLGFPTANLSVPKSQILPANGVYFAKAIFLGKPYRAIVNIGIRPTVTNDKIKVVEVNIFDFDEDIYDQELDVEFYEKIRNEEKFRSVEELKEQILKDKKECKKLYYYGRFALIGKDIKHSKSPEVYSDLINNKNIDYSFYDIKNKSELNIRKFLDKTPFISITSPYKKDVYKLCDEFNGPEEIKTTNCIKLIDGRIVGTNTDFLAIKEIVSSLDIDKYSKTYILGDGAMSDLLSYVLGKKDVEFEVLSRRNNTLNRLNDIDEKNILIINSTSRSYSPRVSEKCSGTFWDLNYAQAYADSLNKNKSLNYINGEKLLQLQAKYALSFWNLKTP